MFKTELHVHTFPASNCARTCPEDMVENFIENGWDSPKVIEHWIQKIAALQQKKKTYEEVLQRQLDDLNSDYRLLQMQSQELYVRNVQGQMRMQAA